MHFSSSSPCLKNMRTGFSPLPSISLYSHIQIMASGSIDSPEKNWRSLNLPIRSFMTPLMFALNSSISAARSFSSKYLRTFFTTIIFALCVFRGVGSSKNDFSFFASFVLADDFIHNVVLQSHWVGVGEQFITGENILVDLHVEFAKKFLNLD